MPADGSHEISIHALFVIFEKVAIFKSVVCCKLYVALYGLKTPQRLRLERERERERESERSLVRGSPESLCCTIEPDNFSSPLGTGTAQENVPT